MTSFVNLMADDRWSEADIVARMEAMIREACGPTEELILHRKMLGSLFGAYTLSPAEQAEIGAYAAVCTASQAAGRAARADMALLARVLDHEQGITPLAEDDAEGLALLEQRAAARPAPEEPAEDGDADPQPS